MEGNGELIADDAPIATSRPAIVARKVLRI
jgi:hypothetical protein